MLKLELNEKELNYIVAVLGKQPMEQVEVLVNNIRTQAQKQKEPSLMAINNNQT